MHYTCLAVNFREGTTKWSNEVYNKFINIHQQNTYLLDHIGKIVSDIGD